MGTNGRGWAQEHYLDDGGYARVTGMAVNAAYDPMAEAQPVAISRLTSHGTWSDRSPMIQAETGRVAEVEVDA